jgi:hypothetical protein
MKYKRLPHRLLIADDHQGVRFRWKDFQDRRRALERGGASEGGHRKDLREPTRPAAMRDYTVSTADDSSLPPVWARYSNINSRGS